MKQKQTVEFVVEKNSSVIQRVGRSYIEQPKTNFKGNPDSTKWYPDRPKKKSI